MKLLYNNNKVLKIMLKHKHLVEIGAKSDIIC